MATWTERIINWFRGTKAEPVKRQYAAAKLMRANRSWTSSPQGANWILRNDLASLRARARDMAKNSPHFRKFLQMAKANIIGHKGIQLQCDVVFSTNGRPHTELNSRIETAFWEWGKRETCTESGRLSWVTAQHLAVEMLIRDGEILVEHILNADNDFGYSIRFWNVDWLDETHNELLRNGHRVIMGVELDAKDRPVAYWLTEPPSENFYGYDSQRRRYRRRVPADQMSHYFLVTEDECQARGVTWFHAALLQGKELHEYAGGVVQSARVASHVFGFIEDQLADGEEYTGGEDVDGNERDLSIDVRSLQVNLLNPGQKFSQFDPKQPTQNHSEFMTSMLHVLAAGLGINGFSLAGDMSEVNFSSARVGLGEERNVWRVLQDFISDTFCRDIFRHWLMEAWLKGRIEMDAKYHAQMMEPTWRPRGWSYIEPQKDIKAALDAIAGNLLTYGEHFADRGIDLEEWLQTKKKEKALFAQYKIEYEPQKPKMAAPAPPVEDEEEPQPAKERSYSNGHYAN